MANIKFQAKDIYAGDNKVSFFLNTFMFTFFI